MSDKRDWFTLSPLAKQKLDQMEKLMPHKKRSEIVSDAIVYLSTIFERKDDASAVDKAASS